MKLISFNAEGVHGYLDFNVNFRQDVNFFAGLNGSGKTSALKMIMAILTPSIKQLSDIQYKYASLEVEDRGKIIVISCNRVDKKLAIRLQENYEDIGYQLISPDDFEYRNPFTSNSEEENEVFKRIKKLTSPIFLSLDRRFIKSTREENEPRFLHHENRAHFADSKLKNGDASINEVLTIAYNAHNKARSRQAVADKRLRDNIILDSLSFGEANSQAHMPNRDTLKTLRRKQLAIKKTLENLDVSSEAFESKFDEFTLKFERIVKKIEIFGDLEKNFFERHEINEDFQEAMSEWFINQDQLKRIDRLFLMVEKYQEEKRNIYKDLSRLEGLVNKFLLETGKSVYINNTGQLKIKFSGIERDLSVLSSGERQILIMFVHLILDRRLKNGVFIIDEPELSLHISWQDMFVAAIQEANPNLQLVLATHSPAIIGGRNHMYVPLNEFL